MASCWHALAQTPGVTPCVLTLRSGTESNLALPQTELMKGLQHRILSTEDYSNYDLIKNTLLEWKPDVVAIAGWFHKPFLRLVSDPSFSSTRFIMFMDNPFRGDLRQWLGRIILRRSLQRMQHVFVTGERSFQLARFLRVPETKIVRGTYGINYRRLQGLWKEREAQWPRNFLFVGQYIERKGISVLLSAYKCYVKISSQPWPLMCCGMGPLKPDLEAVQNVTDLGFKPPDELPAVFAQTGAFILPSLYDAWPLAIVEACGAGLPVVCSEACGSSVELIRPYFNGLTVATGNVEALTRALCWIDRNYEKLPEFGLRSMQFAAPYAAEVWAERVRQCIFDEVSRAR
jgi:glycosyltransferase involved in cell wall biosynthesis